MQPLIVIVGAGPTGLGAAWRLQELGYSNWLLIDRHPYVGGLATSFLDDHGFTWDIAVHVTHSHYRYFDELLDKVLPGGFLEHQRLAWVRTATAWVPYPFQNNIRHLPLPAQQECLAGLRELQQAAGRPPHQKGSDDESLRNDHSHLETSRGLPASFQDWILQTFGRGIADHFLLPYNRKIWSTCPTEMNWHWLGERIPVVDLERVERNVREQSDDVAWGPNYRFRFPQRGGTGAIWKAIAARLPAQQIRLRTSLQKLDIQQREVTLSDGSRLPYDSLISTMPITQLVALTGQQSWVRAASQLRHTRVQVVCLACEFPLPTHLHGKTWIYCPSAEAIFYRVTPFSTFSPAHVPHPERQCSFLCEVSTIGSGTPWREEDLEEQTMRGFAALNLAPVNRQNTRFVHLHAAHGYPIPTLDRDNHLQHIIPELEAQQIYSRGRFGGWKYEVSNMDHSVMQGVEAVNRIILGEPEITWHSPAQVNT